MKALVKAHAERGIWMQDIEAPTIGHNDVLIKVNRTAICGTDIHIYQWDDWAKNTIPVPIAIGHEFCGEIVECGSEVRGFSVGDRVSAEPEHIDEDLTRFRYSFPDGSQYHLNLYPLRKAYTRRLISEVGFQRIKTFGDFQETYQENDPDFFVHVAEKTHSAP